MRLVIIESPFAGDVARNRRYLQRCIRDAIARGESPYASHQMLTDALADLDPEERKLGIEAGFAWRARADATVVYDDHGISSGMKLGIAAAQDLREHSMPSHAIEYRSIGPEPEGAGPCGHPPAVRMTLETRAAVHNRPPLGIEWCRACGSTRVMGGVWHPQNALASLVSP